MQGPARSAKPRGATSKLGSSRPELRAPRLDRAESLTKSRPGPGLDLRVAKRGLTPRRLEVLEPGVRLFDQQELVGFAHLRHRGHLPSLTRAMVGPPSDGALKAPPGVADS